MTVLRTQKEKVVAFLAVTTLVLGSVFAASGALSAQQAGKQKTFVSSEKAAQVLFEAVKAGDKKTLSAMFGPEAVSWLSSGDAVRDAADREWFIRAYETKNFLKKEDADRCILHVGNDDWPFPFPLIKKGHAWFFDAAAGREELLNRRIGRNELRVLETMEAYVVAQREYASKDRTGSGVHAYAQKFMSTPGKKDGLYWPVTNGEEESPLGPLVAMAAREGYGGKTRKPAPYQGYYFTVLTAQGMHAPGGAYEYAVKGNMILGFGLLAYPARYGSSGIMTFIVNQQGVVYEKDLGRKTAAIAAAMRIYDPDKTWRKVESPGGGT